MSGAGSRTSATVSLLLVVLATGLLHAQLAPPPWDDGAAGLGLVLRRLPVTGSVLYVTAHPDDENNAVLVALSRGRGLRVGLLTATRGDGGQNALGHELFEALGVLRTEELAAVHRYDGALQYFARAYEFGYSFSVEETFEKWGREETLGDFVRVIRAFRPDVILTLPLEGTGGGQHHQAAGRLAKEAFRAAADPNRFPEQLREGLRPWQARKIYRGSIGDTDEGRPMDGVALPVGTYDPLLGMSFLEFGSLARSQHKSQWITQLRTRPRNANALHVLLDSEPSVSAPESDLLDGIDVSLRGLLRFTGRDSSIEAALQDLDADVRLAGEAYDARALHKTLQPLRSGLARLRDLLQRVRSGPLDETARYELLHRLVGKEKDFSRALALAHGLDFDVTADDGDVVPRQTFSVTARVFNRGPEAFRADHVSLSLPAGWTARLVAGEEGPLREGDALDVKYAVTVAPDARYSQPYWKRKPGRDRYDLEVPGDDGLPWSPPPVAASLRFTTGDVAIRLDQAAVRRYAGRWVGGEKQKVVTVVPALSLRVSPEAAVFPLGSPPPKRVFHVKVLNNQKHHVAATVRLEVPTGWLVEPREARLELQREDEEHTAPFVVTPARGFAPGKHAINAVAIVDGEEFRQGNQVIAYDHIQERYLLRPATAQATALDVKLRPGLRVGYVMGVGDEVPAAIEQLGAALTILGPEDLAWGALSRYDVVVTGVRAYTARPDLRAHHLRLLRYVEGGGHLVVQYNRLDFNSAAGVPTPPEAGVSPYAPYPAAVANHRISVEEAPVRFLVTDHPLLRVPNVITTRDFDGWVQERGLQFLEVRDPRYTDLLASTDPWPYNAGEKKGMLVEARVGRGTWTYVGLGLFRQLPAGVPGAYRLLANLLSRPAPK